MDHKNILFIFQIGNMTINYLLMSNSRLWCYYIAEINQLKLYFHVRKTMTSPFLKIFTTFRSNFDAISETNIIILNFTLVCNCNLTNFQKSNLFNHWLKLTDSTRIKKSEKRSLVYLPLSWFKNDTYSRRFKTICSFRENFRSYTTWFSPKCVRWSDALPFLWKFKF